ncbi:hypothetical protein Q5741_13840 [Paenibacillus sp. JX-17]|uniref:DUF4652 domain-containing protein n=1 Tax=Paenibacillus lacisoli TaxID=3064525 RepID=A0ABT9CDY6_9BACL|nr:hypothetical protein [Paenibacillus sp. JX-17]MDO7907488.1 hypothetical protein [Paenibacillus sp. JX-17]
MNILKIILAILLFSMMTACAADSNNEPAAANGLDAKVKMNYDISSVEEAMSAKGITFNPRSSRQDWVLAGVKPHEYAVGSAREKSAPAEEASIYIFASEQQRKEGLADFHQQAEQYDMNNPKIYQKRNVLILYWTAGDPNKTIKLNENFTNATNSLRIVTEFTGFSSGNKEIPYTIRIGGGIYGGIAYEKGAVIESVDTHRSGKMHTIQIRGWRIPSAITVEYKGKYVEVNYTEGSSSHKENVLVSFRDESVDPSHIRIRLNGREQRAVGMTQGTE